MTEMHSIRPDGEVVPNTSVPVRTPRPRPTTDKVVQAADAVLGEVSNLQSVTLPIPAMRSVWGYRPADRAITYQRKETVQAGDGTETITTDEVVGYVPKVTGMVTRRAEDGRHTAIEYRMETKDGTRVITEDDLDTGSWAGKLGLPKPSGRDACQAFATVIRSQGAEAPEATGIPYKDQLGNLHLPDATSQEIGYRVTAGDEDRALTAWQTIADHARQHPRTLLALGAVFVGPLVESFDVPAHILNLVGDPQTGKSTSQKVQAALFGATKGFQIFGQWNSSPQGIPQTLKNARFLPMVREEFSTSGLQLAAAERLLSQIVGGADRATGGRDGNTRPSVGRWQSILSSSSNAPLRRTGQTEDLASRLYEIHSPFWTDWEAADTVEELAEDHHGWPLEWAVRNELFSAASIRAWKVMHREVTGRLHPEGGGFARTIAKTHAAWVVGAAMLGKVLRVEGLEQVAEAVAAELLPDAVVSAGAATVPPGQSLWDALDAARVVTAQFPTDIHIRQLLEANDTRDHVRGYVRIKEKELWVFPESLNSIAREAGIENVSACIDDLKRRGVLVPGDGRNDRSRLAPRSLREIDGLPSRMWRFSIEKGKAAYEPEAEDDQAETVTGCRGCGAPMEFDDGSGYHPTCDPGTASGWGPDTIGADAWEQEQQLAVDTEPEPTPTPEPARPAKPSTSSPRPVRQPVDVQPIADRVAEELAKADGDPEKAITALKKRAIQDAMEILDATRATARYDYTAHPPEPEILKKPGRNRSNQIWEARPSWTNRAVPAGTEVHSLDVNAAYLSATNTSLPIGALQHSTSGEFNRRRSGVYLITPPEWTHTDIPNPLGNREEAGQLWVTRPTLQLLTDLSTEKYGQLCEAPVIHESWTSGSTENMLRGLREIIREARAAAIASGDDVTLEYVKAMYSKFVSTATKASQANHLLERTDWAQIIRAQAHGNLWRRALKAHQAGLTVVSIKGTDELHVAGDWQQVFPEGRALTEMKSKDTYRIGE